MGPLSAALFGLACMVILVLTFVLGMLVGRQWAGRTVPEPGRIAASAGSAGRGGGVRAGGSAPERPGATEPSGGAGGDGAEARHRGVRKLGERERDDATPQIREKLTFYQTLTAPLTAGPRPAKRRAPAPATPPSREGGRESGPALAAMGSATGAYTIQVGAFTTRAQADRLRETFGPAAYVLESVVPGEARFRVRVGAFGDRAEADAAAARLRTEHGLVGFVTTR